MISSCVFSTIIFGILVSSFYVFKKSIGYAASKRQIILTVGWCMLLAAIYAAAPLLILFPLACFMSVVFAFVLTKQKFETVASAYLLSFGISCVLYYIAMTPVSVVSALLLLSRGIVVDTPIDHDQPVFLLLYALTAVLQFVLAFLLFRIRRFKNGFPFIFKRYTIVVALFFTGMILIFVTWVNMLARSEEEIAEEYYLIIAGVLLAG